MEVQDRIAMVILKLSKTFPVRVCEWLLASIMVSWGVAVWNHSAYAWSQPMYAGMARIADNKTWGAIVCTIGVIRLAALLRNGGWQPSPHFRAGGAFLACFAWLQISLGMFAAPVVTAGIAIYPWLLFADIYNVFRASSDARESDERFRSQSAERGRLQGAHSSGN